MVAFLCCQHCRLYKKDGSASKGVYVEDLSTNGTYVNSAAIGGKHKSVRLNDGDHIQFKDPALKADESNISGKEQNSPIYIFHSFKSSMGEGNRSDNALDETGANL